MADKIIARIARALCDGDPVNALVHRMPPTDLQSLMLHVYRERSARRQVRDLVDQYGRSNMVRPSTGDARVLHAIERVAFDCASAFEALELAPIAPLGLNRVLGRIDQNNCLATVRGAEVLADPTTAAALECARRRRAGHGGDIRLCSRARLLRLQPFDVPGFSPHFGTFSMVSAGRDRGDLRFELESLCEHVTVYLELLLRLAAAGHAVDGIVVEVSDTARDRRRMEASARDVLAPLSERYPSVTFRLDDTREQGRTYYEGLCLSVHAHDASGEPMNVADGGCTDWTRRLLSNQKERMLVSAIGIELLVKRSPPPPVPAVPAAT